MKASKPTMTKKRSTDVSRIKSQAVKAAQCTKATKTYEITVKRRAVTARRPCPTPPAAIHHDISDIAKRLKQNLSAAMAKASALPSMQHVKPDDTCGSSNNHCTSAASPLSSSDWPTPKPTLRNLKLLKEYLAFIAHDSTVDIVTTENGHSIHITTSPSTDWNTDTTTTTHSPACSPDATDQTARLGAHLIESMVHDHCEMDKCLDDQHEPQDKKSQACRATPYTASRLERRRPGRPPKPKQFFDEDPCNDPVKRVRRPSKSSTPVKRCTKKKPEHQIQCICDTPHEEFGAMVQCDDCSTWLHVECLDLDDHALEETFRCPSCYMTLGAGKQTKLTSSMSWRFAAQWRSQRLAALHNDDAATSDEEEDVVVNSHSYPLTEITNTQSPRLCRPSTPVPVVTPCVSIDHSNSRHGDVTNNTISRESSLELESDVDARTPGLMSCNTNPMDWSTSSENDSPSEASTPDQTFSCFDSFEPASDEMIHHGITLDPESLEFLSRLMYLQSLDSVKKELFAPNASDVFLCENINNTIATTTTAAPPPSPAVGFAPDAPPSSICSQDLSEFSFDSGPFWEPLLF
ncbi:uncharacterized protein BYT42DRAFT_320170 [Radiomyces spectabilis]|uniref:uncharacterized protein n=1 Tax=Radiomyces spectabilis TaxID=64574 RepID=UPI00221E7F4B|nr:uncharacterized protein BYT42DRAFT_320170 [Radiomyces spectabilis]KAI8379242.1 hypothetical protein BYT42DRAFT_320170 [Radiomyces spectabilis]